jgi:hypothetical protein
MLKNSGTLAVSVAIHISMKLSFVSVNDPREIYFVDEPRTLHYGIENTAVEFRHADHVAPSIPKRWQSLRRQAAVARSV